MSKITVIKRNGNKGRVIGIDGNSKTYTILFKEGKTGEYFFSDVEDLNDEVNRYDIKTPSLDLEYSSDITNEGSSQNFSEAPGSKGGTHRDARIASLTKKSMAQAPDRKTGSSPKFIEDSKGKLASTPSSKRREALTGKGIKSKTANLADLPKSGAKKSGKKFVDDLSNLDLAKAPNGSIKGSSKFIEDNKNMNLATFLSIIRTKLNITKKQAIFTFVKSYDGYIMCPMNESIEQIYNSHRSNDNFLYLKFGIENTFG